MPRECGECYVCCEITEVVGAAFKKPAKVQCPFLKDCPTYKCGIYETRPECCSTFQCAWLKDYGDEDARPDKCHVMLSVNTMNGGNWIFAMETEKDAVITTGKEIIMELIESLLLPAIVVKHGFNPENNKGDYVIVHQLLLFKSKQLIGKFLGYLDDEETFGMYELKVN
jgi:hypothetical protein